MEPHRLELCTIARERERSEKRLARLRAEHLEPLRARLRTIDASHEKAAHELRAAYLDLKDAYVSASGRIAAEREKLRTEALEALSVHGQLLREFEYAFGAHNPPGDPLPRPFRKWLASEQQKSGDLEQTIHVVQREGRDTSSAWGAPESVWRTS